MSASGDETISVFESEMRFHVKIHDMGPDSYMDRTYPYTVMPDGRIQPLEMRSVDAAFGIGRFAWYWDGERITQKDKKSDAPVKIFVLER